MSSTLFARGTNTQVGLRRRAEEVNKNITDLRDALDSLKDLPRDFRVMRTRVEALETRNPVIEELTKKNDDLNSVLTAHTDKLAMFEAYLPYLEKLTGVIEKMDKMEALADTLTQMNEKSIAAEEAIKKFEETIAAQTSRVASMRSDLTELEKAVSKFSSAAESN